MFALSTKCLGDLLRSPPAELRLEVLILEGMPIDGLTTCTILHGDVLRASSRGCDAKGPPKGHGKRIFTLSLSKWATTSTEVSGLTISQLRKLMTSDCISVMTSCITIKHRLAVPSIATNGHKARNHTMKYSSQVGETLSTLASACKKLNGGASHEADGGILGC